MIELIQVFVKLVDPVAFFVVFAVCGLTFRIGKLSMLLAAVVGAAIAETLLTSIGYGRHWGQGIVAGVIAGLVQAGVAYWIISKLFGRKQPAAVQAPE